nr:hypothetical protein LBZUJACN_LBZUJACN_CDS_0036 [Caudoviricetes sp.]CAI9751045.1 hypothetical protein MIHLRAQX_MIHLRAQX_CDS_0036 [Caudoviricetes sp.]
MHFFHFLISPLFIYITIHSILFMSIKKDSY